MNRSTNTVTQTKEANTTAMVSSRSCAKHTKAS